MTFTSSACLVYWQIHGQRRFIVIATRSGDCIRVSSEGIGLGRLASRSSQWLALRSMGELGNRMAKGAAWMVLFKLLERGLGLASTLVLARLLIPADFGIVAMATSVIGLLEILAGFSFDIALIQKQDAEEHHYHTAWTLNLLTYATMALLMVLLAAPVATFYREPRVEQVLYALSFGVFLVGFENIGTVAFRKELQLRKDFNFLLGKKLIAAVVGITAAIAFRSYWALVAGMVTSRLVGVVLSYAIHPFRPRLSLHGSRELLKFSSGLFLYYLVVAITTRVPDFIIGRGAGPAGLGAYNIGAEFANLPTTELLMPIHRAVLPGYAKMAGDRASLSSGFLTVLALAALVFVPAAVGIAAIAEPLVHVLLGSKWVAAVPVIQVLAFAGLLNAFQTNANYVFMASGRMRISNWIGLLQFALLVPALIAGIHWSGLVGASWGVLGATAVILPVVYFAILKELGLRSRDYVAVLLRPALGAGLMLAVITTWKRWLDMTAFQDSHIVWLFSSIAIGALVYCGAVLLLWRFAGKPAGAESHVLEAVKAKLGGMHPRSTSMKGKRG